MSGLGWAATSTLKSLHDAIADNRLPCPLTPLALDAEGFDPRLAEPLAGLGKDACLQALALVLEAREHPGPVWDLVWTGPEAVGTQARDTWVVLRDLLHGAAHSIVIAGYRFDDGKELFEPVYQRLRQAELTVDMFLDVPQAASPSDVDAQVREHVKRFLGRNWPFGPPYPNLYYDPRTVDPTIHASMHAKCVVVDETKCLIGSANFTNRGQTRNIELGLLVEDPDLARRVLRQWRGLVSAGFVERFNP